MSPIHHWLFNALVQGYSNSSALAMKLLQSCTESSICKGISWQLRHSRLKNVSYAGFASNHILISFHVPNSVHSRYIGAYPQEVHCDAPCRDGTLCLKTCAIFRSFANDKFRYILFSFYFICRLLVVTSYILFRQTMSGNYIITMY